MKRIFKSKLCLLICGFIAVLLSPLLYAIWSDFRVNQSISNWESFLASHVPKNSHCKDADKALTGRYSDRAIYEDAGAAAITVYYQVDNDIDLVLCFGTSDRLWLSYAQRRGQWELWEHKAEPKLFKRPPLPPRTFADGVNDWLNWCKSKIGK